MEVLPIPTEIRRTAWFEFYGRAQDALYSDSDLRNFCARQSVCYLVLVNLYVFYRRTRSTFALMLPDRRIMPSPFELPQRPVSFFGSSIGTLHHLFSPTDGHM